LGQEMYLRFTPQLSGGIDLEAYRHGRNTLSVAVTIAQGFLGW